MAKSIFRRRLILQGNRYFGSLIYFIDSKGRGCLKFTCKLKIGKAVLWRQKNGEEKVVLKNPRNKAVSLDISYKYTDSLLEIKSEEKGNLPEPVFIPVKLPPDCYLFSLRVKNLDALSIVSLKKDDIILNSPDNSSEVVLFVSFTNESGKGFIDPIYMDKSGIMVFVDIPVNHIYNKIAIAITDKNLKDQELDLTFHVPEYKDKKTIIP